MLAPRGGCSWADFGRLGLASRRTFEERLAELKKPDPVPNPDQDAVNEKLSRLNAKIEKCDKRLVSASHPFLSPRLVPRAEIRLFKHAGFPHVRLVSNLRTCNPPGRSAVS